MRFWLINQQPSSDRIAIYIYIAIWRLQRSADERIGGRRDVGTHFPLE
jgi:hypothetical protein